MPGSLTNGFLWSRWRGKRSRHSRHMRDPTFYVSDKRPLPQQAIWLALDGVKLNVPLITYSCRIDAKYLTKWSTQYTTYNYGVWYFGSPYASISVSVSARIPHSHYGDVILRGMASQITSVSMVCSIVCSGVDQKKTSKFHVTCIGEGNSTVTSNAENVSIWWRHHAKMIHGNSMERSRSDIFELRNCYSHILAYCSSPSNCLIYLLNSICSLYF